MSDVAGPHPTAAAAPARAPRVPQRWTDNAHPAPASVTLLNGMLFDDYDKSLVRTWHDPGGRRAHHTVEDPHTGRFAVVLGARWTMAARMWFCDPDGVFDYCDSLSWPWEAAEGAAHVLTWHAWRDANRAGLLVPYWITD